MLTERQALQPGPDSTCKMNTRLWVSNIRVDFLGQPLSILIQYLTLDTIWGTFCEEWPQ